MTAEPSLQFGGVTGADRSDRTAAELQRWSAAMLIGSACCVAALVGWRRLAEALSRPLDPLLLLIVGGLLVVVVVGGRVLWRQFPNRCKPSRGDWLLSVLTSAAVLGLGAALSLPGSNPIALGAFWALLAGEELWAWQSIARRRLYKVGNPARPLRVDPPQALSPRSLPPEFADEVPTGEVLQQLTRSQRADGSEQLTGWLRTPFAAGQRTARVHVAFCPPFPETPRVSVAQVGGPPTRIKTAQFPYGARLDLKLAEMAEQPDNVLLRFSARSKTES